MNATTQVPTYVVPNPGFVVSNEQSAAEPYKSTFKGVGITQVVIGSICLILGVVLGVLLSTTYFGSGIWIGVWYSVSGSLAVSAGTNPNSCNVIAGLVISILATIVAFSALIVDGLAASAFIITGAITLGAIHAVLAILSVVEFVIAIVHSAYCCKANCGRPMYQPTVIATTAVTTMPMQQHPQPVPPAYTTEKM